MKVKMLSAMAFTNGSIVCPKQIITIEDEACVKNLIDNNLAILIEEPTPIPEKATKPRTTRSRKPKEEKVTE